VQKVSRKEWRARYRALVVEKEVVDEELAAARAWAADAEVRADGLESEQLRLAAQFRNILTALGRSDAPSPGQVSKARRICREELP